MMCFECYHSGRRKQFATVEAQDHSIVPPQSPPRPSSTPKPVDQVNITIPFSRYHHISQRKYSAQGQRAWNVHIVTSYWAAVFELFHPKYESLLVSQYTILVLQGELGDGKPSFKRILIGFDKLKTSQGCLRHRRNRCEYSMSFRNGKVRWISLGIVLLL